MRNFICVCTGTKFDEWYVQNLEHMLRAAGGMRDGEKLHVIREERYEGVFNKLLMFEEFREGQNIYFDLDVVIKGDINNLIRSDLTLCHAWWREAYHTPLNSSVMSWEGDMSSIHDKFAEDPEFNMFTYRSKRPGTPDGTAGVDEFIYKNFDHECYSESDGICSWKTEQEELDRWSVYLFNQNYQLMKKPGWIQQYQLPLSATQA